MRRLSKIRPQTAPMEMPEHCFDAQIWDVNVATTCCWSSGIRNCLL